MRQALIKGLAKIIVAFKCKPKKKQKDKTEKFKQYTKVFVTNISIVACIWVTWSYILSTYALIKFGNIDSLSMLSGQVVTSIICVSLGYMTKAFIETYCEHKIDFDDVVPQQTSTTVVEYNGDGGDVIRYEQ